MTRSATHVACYLAGGRVSSTVGTVVFFALVAGDVTCVLDESHYGHSSSHLGCAAGAFNRRYPCCQRWVDIIHGLMVDSMIRLREPVRVSQFAKMSRSRIVRSFVRSVQFPFPVAVNRIMECTHCMVLS